MAKTEAELIAEVLAGEVHAFRPLIERHQHRAYAMARRLVSPSEVAEDLVQEAMVKAFENLGSFRREASFGTWLCRIVTNQCLQHLRRQKRLPPQTNLPDEWGSVPPQGQRDLEQADRAAMIQQALQQLAPKERLVLQLYYLDELSLEEIVQHTGFSASNVKTLLHRGRKKFRQHCPPTTLEMLRHEA